MRNPVRSRFGLICAVAVLGVAFAGTLPAAEFQEEYAKAATTILCDCGCHPQSIHDCACGRAAEMRNEVTGMIRSGMTGDEVIEAYVAEKGEQIRIAPEAEGFNLVAWLGPGLLFLVAAGALLLLLRRWSRSASETRQEAPPEIDPEDPYVARLKKELEDYP